MMHGVRAQFLRAYDALQKKAFRDYFADRLYHDVRAFRDSRGGNIAAIVAAMENGTAERNGERRGRDSMSIVSAGLMFYFQETLLAWTIRTLNNE